ncbi:MAG TPA: NYN domain-containing protein [Zeimonas sp.]
MSAAQLTELVRLICEHERLADMRLHRVYYYDAAPFDGTRDKPLRGGKVDFKKHEVYAQSRTLHQELRTEPFVALRMGELLFRGWAIDRSKLHRWTPLEHVELRAADLKPMFTQKGVDMRLGMDVAALTLKRLVNVIVLVAGDSDFVPAMKFARREGTQLFLVPLRSPVRDPMLEHADDVLRIAFPTARAEPEAPTETFGRVAEVPIAIVSSTPVKG